MSHHPCWRQEEQIPSGTPKLVRHPCFWKTPYFIPCAWQQWLSKLRAERCWVVFELVSRWCKCVWGSCSGGWMSHWWLCWYCSRVVTGGSGVRSWQKPSLTVTVWATLWDPGRLELLRSWFSLQSCVSEGTAPELQPFGVFGGFLFSCWHYPGSSKFWRTLISRIALGLWTANLSCCNLPGKPPVVTFADSGWSGGFSSGGLRAGLKWSATASREVGFKQACWGLIHCQVWGKFEQFNPSEMSLLSQQDTLLQ